MQNNNLLKSLMLFALLLSSSVYTNEYELTRNIEFPLAVKSDEALARLQEHYREHCANALCKEVETGNFLLLDLSDEPEWREIRSFDSTSFTYGYGDIGAYTAFIKPRKPTTIQYWGGHPVYGLLFHRLDLPLARPGKLEPISGFQIDQPFTFNDQLYQFEIEHHCHDVLTSPPMDGKDANVSVTLVSKGIRQKLSLSPKHRTDAAVFPDCEAAIKGQELTIQLDFIGDLDGDQKPDFVFLNNGGGEFPAIFLSAQAEKGTLVKYVSVNLSC